MTPVLTFTVLLLLIACVIGAFLAGLFAVPRKSKRAALVDEACSRAIAMLEEIKRAHAMNQAREKTAGGKMLPHTQMNEAVLFAAEWLKRRRITEDPVFLHKCIAAELARLRASIPVARA